MGVDVGDAVGAFVGNADGDAEGTVVGREVGDTVGMEVGATVKLLKSDCTITSPWQSETNWTNSDSYTSGRQPVVCTAIMHGEVLASWRVHEVVLTSSTSSSKFINL